MNHLSDEKINKILREYSLPTANQIRFIDSSRGREDLRHNYIIDRKYVLRVNEPLYYTEERFTELNRLIDRYHEFGLKAPCFLKKKDGGFIYEGHIYLSDYLDYPLANSVKERNALDEKNESEPGMIDERLKLVAGFAEKYRDVDLIRTRSMYSLFDLAPYDAPIGIDEKQQNLNDLIQTLEEAGQNIVSEKLVHRNKEIREELLSFYKTLPQCVFQGDENFSNLCVDETGRYIIGLFDFNMAGTDVIANYLANLSFQGKFFYTKNIFEKYDAGQIWEKVLTEWQRATEMIERYYLFTEAEKRAYCLYSKIVMFSSYVNVSAFRYFLKKEGMHRKTVDLLERIILS